MALFKRGLNEEDRLRTKLEAAGCVLQFDPILDHAYKLDFVLTRFPENPRFYSLGVQVSTRIDDLDKLEEFVKTQLAGGVTQRSLYLELDPAVDLEAGGALTALTVLLQYQLDRQFGDTTLIAARVFSNLTYQIYDPEKRILQLRAKASEAVPAAQPKQPVKGMSAAEGAITSYLRHKGYGTIESMRGERYFFHIKYVVDGELLEQLNDLPMTGFPATLDLPVCFTDIGRSREDAANPEARNIRLAAQ